MNSYQVAELFFKEGIPQKTVDKFFDYHCENPDVWKNFEKFALKAANLGKRVGAKCIIEKVRYEVDVEINSKEPFKINNNFPAYYARLFHYKHPEHYGFFETREIKGLNNE